MDEELLTVAEVSRLLRKSIYTTYAMVSAGRLPAFRVGGSIRFRRAEIQQWIDDNRIAKPVKPRTATAAG